MKKLSLHRLIGVFCLLLILATPALAEDTKEKDFSSSQGWVQGIEVPMPGYRTWVEGLQPPEKAPEEKKGGIDAMVESIMTPINNVLYNGVFFSVPFMGAKLKLVIAWLIIGSVFCTFYFGFLNVRGFAQAIRLVRGDYSDPNSKEAGEVSHFQALATALSGTVGVGNIGAIPILLLIGGPGALFWLMVAGLIGMSAKFCECTLGVMYRRENPDGTVSGGPMYAMLRGFAQLGRPKLGKFLSYFFAISLVVGCLGAGNMFQSNQAVMQFVNITGGADSYFATRGWIFGVGMAIVVGLVILGGIKGIAKLTEKLVPFMALFYLSGALVVLAAHANRIPAAIASVFSNAFTPEAATGGFVAIMIIGFQRAVFSNEAGIGTAAIAHSAVKTNEPITEGLVALLEPFIDTVVICAITGLVILTTVYGDPSVEGLTGVSLTSEAMSRTIPWVPKPLAVAVLLFAFSTIVSWSYYGLKGWTYIFGESRFADLSFKAIYCFFIVVGCAIPLTAVMDFSDAMVLVPREIGRAHV